VSEPDETATAAPTFVFVHDLGSNSFFWTPVVHELALLGHRSLPEDLPGHGLDATVPLSYQAQDIAASVAEPSPIAAITKQDNVAHVHLRDAERAPSRPGYPGQPQPRRHRDRPGRQRHTRGHPPHRLPLRVLPIHPGRPSAMTLSQAPEATKDVPIPNTDNSLFLGMEPVTAYGADTVVVLIFSLRACGCHLAARVIVHELNELISAKENNAWI
jgi:hypothetical protein